VVGALLLVGFVLTYWWLVVLGSPGGPGCEVRAGKV